MIEKILDKLFGQSVSLKKVAEKMKMKPEQQKELPEPAVSKKLSHIRDAAFTLSKEPRMFDCLHYGPYIYYKFNTTYGIRVAHIKCDKNNELGWRSLEYVALSEDVYLGVYAQQAYILEVLHGAEPVFKVDIDRENKVSIELGEHHGHLTAKDIDLALLELGQELEEDLAKVASIKDSKLDRERKEKELSKYFQDEL